MAALMFRRRTNSCVFHNSFQMDITNVFRTLTKATAERRKNSTKSIVSSKDKKNIRLMRIISIFSIIVVVLSVGNVVSSNLVLWKQFLWLHSADSIPLNGMNKYEFSGFIRHRRYLFSFYRSSGYLLVIM